MSIDTNNAERLATMLERVDEYEPLGHVGWEAAALIRAQAAEIKQARQTAEYWKAAHLADNAEIDRLNEAIHDVLSRHQVTHCHAAARAALKRKETP